MAAAAGFVLILGAQFWRSSTGTEPVAITLPQVHETGPGVIDSVLLVDGTRVVLAPGSQLSVPADFGGDGRVVELKGVGMFDVVHDEKRPFTVRSGGVEIQDVGTVFTVRADSGDQVRVAVQEGKVFMRGSGSGVYLDAGDVGTAAATGDAVALRGEAKDEEVAWTSGRLVFREATMTEVASELRRWYGVELRAADSATSSLRLTAEFRGEPIEQVVNEITLALNVRVERTGDTLVVRAKGGKR
jgi:transmembrane sensor